MAQSDSEQPNDRTLFANRVKVFNKCHAAPMMSGNTREKHAKCSCKVLCVCVRVCVCFCEHDANADDDVRRENAHDDDSICVAYGKNYVRVGWTTDTD